MALRDLPWRDYENLPPYPERCLLLGLDTLDRRRKVQQATIIAKLLNNDIDSTTLLSKLNFRASQRTLRSSNLLNANFHRTNFGYNEPVTACVRMFTSVEEFFDFGETTRKFVQKLSRSSIL